MGAFLVKRFAVRIALGLVALALLIPLSAWIGSSIPRNAGWREPANGIEIMIETNGVHTAIVVPLVSPQKDWRKEFPVSDITAPNRPYTHLAVSWGEREVFLNTPTWSDLSPMTVLRILAIGGDGLIHAAHYVRPAPADDLRPLRISEAAYARLVQRIEASLPPAGQAHSASRLFRLRCVLRCAIPLHGDQHLQPMDQRHACGSGHPHRLMDAVFGRRDKMGAPARALTPNGFDLWA